MALTNTYLKGVYDGLAERYPYQPEYLQAVFEVLESLQPLVEKDPKYEKKSGYSYFLQWTFVEENQRYLPVAESI